MGLVKPYEVAPRVVAVQLRRFFCIADCTVYTAPMALPGGSPRRGRPLAPSAWFVKLRSVTRGRYCVWAGAAAAVRRFMPPLCKLGWPGGFFASLRGFTGRGRLCNSFRANSARPGFLSLGARSLGSPSSFLWRWAVCWAFVKVVSRPPGLFSRSGLLVSLPPVAACSWPGVLCSNSLALVWARPARAPKRRVPHLDRHRRGPQLRPGNRVTAGSP